MCLLQSSPTLRNHVNCSPPGSSVHEILQARILEWVAPSSSTGSCSPRDGTQVSCLLHLPAGSLPLAPPGKPMEVLAPCKDTTCNDASHGLWCVEPNIWPILRNIKKKRRERCYRNIRNQVNLTFT